MLNDQDKRGPDGNPPFIQEKVLSKKKARIKKFFISLAGTLVLAIFFGLTASLVFCVSRPFFERHFGKSGGKQRVILASSPSPSPSPTPALNAAAPPDDNKPTQKPRSSQKPAYDPSLKDLTKLYSLLSDTAAQVNHSIVTVSGVISGMDVFENPLETVDSCYGLILYRTADEFMILTSGDRIAKANKIRVTFEDGAGAEASLCGYDGELGLAVIAVPLEELSEPTLETAKTAVIGESYQVGAGMPVLALGSPNGYVHSMELGMVTGRMYDQYITDYKLDLFNTDLCNISEGEGVIVNLDGEVVGVITHKFSGDRKGEISTAIGITKLAPLIDKLANREERIYLGIVGRELNGENGKAFPVKSGIYVTEVQAKSPAFEAGIRNGDIITKLGDAEIATIAGFWGTLNNSEPGRRVPIEIIRTSKDNSPLMLFVVLEEKGTIIE